MNPAMSALDGLDFIGCGIAFTSGAIVREAVSSQLAKWWKHAIDPLSRPSALPLHLPKEHSPRRKEVALFGIGIGDGTVTLIEANLRDIYRSLMSMVSRALPDVTFVEVRSCPVGRCEHPIEDFGVFRNGSEYLRHVWVALDGRWRFGESGQVQPYERAEDLSQRLMKRRLTRAHIVRNLAAMGVPLETIATGEGVRHVASFRERLQEDQARPGAESPSQA